MHDIAFDASPGEARALLFENGNPVELHIQRSGQVTLGSVCEGRILTKAAAHDYVRLTGGQEIIVSPKSNLAEGALIRAEIVREQMCEPGEVKLAVARPCDADLIDTADQWQATLGARADRVVDYDAAFDDHFDLALAGRSNVGGVTLWFERTKAGLVFDVDGQGDPLAINRVAAVEVARLLRLFQVGGAAMIDFVGMDSKAARLDVAAAFDAASAADLRGFERTAINGYGLMQVIRAHPRPSLLDTLFGIRRVSPSDETMAFMLLREASRSSGAGVRRCVTTPALAALLAQSDWQPLIAQASRAAGAPLEIVADASVRGYGHVHVTQV
jgi:ribonuclease G